jgi:hypothetical protein
LGEWNIANVFETSREAYAFVFLLQDGYGQYQFKSVWLDAAEPERNGNYNFGEFMFQQGTDTV